MYYIHLYIIYMIEYCDSIKQYEEKEILLKNNLEEKEVLILNMKDAHENEMYILKSTLNDYVRYIYIYIYLCI